MEPTATIGPTAYSVLVERVTFHNEENGYCVLRVKAQGKKELITPDWIFEHHLPGENLEAQGPGRTIASSGFSSKPTQSRRAHPSTLEGIERYLGSGMVRGIGPHFAREDGRDVRKTGF